MQGINRSGIITLTTDFGLRDAYLGIMKGVILGIFPSAKLVDLSHNLEPQNIQEASYILLSAVKFFPPGTVHLAVVDPGVGSARRAVIVESKPQFLVGPDNGIFTDFINNKSRIYELTERKFFLNKISQTFHGRDIFAPVSAHLAKGVSPEELGTRIQDPILLARPKPKMIEEKIKGEVIYIDRFGNLITNIKEEMIPQKPIIRIMGKEIIGLAKNYAEQAPGTLIAIIGSAGFLEISLTQDNAGQKLKASIGQAVELESEPD